MSQSPRRLIRRAAFWAAVVLVGIALGSLIATSAPLIRFAAAAGYALASLGLSAWFEHQDMRKSVDAIDPLALRVADGSDEGSAGGYRLGVVWALYALVAVLFGYSIAFRQTWAVVPAAAAWWFGQSLSERVTRSRLIRERVIAMKRGDVAAGVGQTVRQGLDMLAMDVFAMADAVASRIEDPLERATTLVAAVGALAGYACQATVRALASDKGLPTQAALVEVKAGDESFYFGDALNDFLTADTNSVWHLGTEAARRAGATKLPDRDALFARVASAVGSPAFGRSSDGGGVDSLRLLHELWSPVTDRIAQVIPDRRRWIAVINMAVSPAVAAASKTLGADAAVRILLESAVAMSKVDLDAARVRLDQPTR